MSNVRRVKLVGEAFSAANWDENEWIVGDQAVNDFIEELSQNGKVPVAVTIEVIERDE